MNKEEQFCFYQSSDNQSLILAVKITSDFSTCESYLWDTSVDESITLNIMDNPRFYSDYFQLPLKGFINLEIENRKGRWDLISLSKVRCHSKFIKNLCNISKDIKVDKKWKSGLDKILKLQQIKKATLASRL